MFAGSAHYILTFSLSKVNAGSFGLSGIVAATI